MFVSVDYSFAGCSSNFYNIESTRADEDKLKLYDCELCKLSINILFVCFLSFNTWVLTQFLSCLLLHNEKF